MDTVIELFEDAVAAHGTRRALVIKPGFRTLTWTYAAIGDLVPCVARSLRDAGAVAALALPVRAPRPSITTRPSAAGRASP